jgi:hypothetical protein
MSEVPQNGQLLRTLQATSEQQAAIAGMLVGLGLPVPGIGAGEKVVSVYFVVGPGGGDNGASNQWAVFSGQREGKGTEVGGQGRYRFQNSGSHWEAVFAGGARFIVPDGLGARYVDFLLHHPNRVIKALDLEISIRADKGSARAEDTKQEALDHQAQRELERELVELKAERQLAQEDDNTAAVERLTEEIRTIEAALRQQGGMPGDAGERARNNVRKAIGAFMQRLRQGNKYQKALAAHIKQHINLGYEVVYHQPEGEIWR